MKYQFYFLCYVDNISVVCRCIQRNISLFIFMRKCFFKSLWQREAQASSFLRSNSLWTAYTSFINKPPSFFWGHCFLANILIQMYFSEEWEQIYQLSKHNNRSEFSCHKFSSNLIWINSPISLCYLHREKLPCDSLLNMKVIWICYFLFNLHKFMSGYLYFPNILKDRKDHV